MSIQNKNKYCFLANPKLLEDKLWQKDLGVKDYFKFEKCDTVQIGNCVIIPVLPSGDLFICRHGIRMTVFNKSELFSIFMLY